MNVAVVGLGKVGLPLAVQYASRGFSVFGCDLDATLVNRINGGECPVAGEADLEERLAEVQQRQLFRATTDTAAAVADSDIVVIIVPVGLTGERVVDFAKLDAAVDDIRRGLTPDSLVVVETTVPVGTTRKRVGASLAKERHQVLLAASPERVTTGQIFRDLRTYPKIIGAVDEASWLKAEAFYNQALEAPCLLRVRDPETAEFAKLAEGIYRDVNIALADEFARYADSIGVDVTEAIEAANSQPYSHIHRPGVGVGGHCLPVYPHFLPEGELHMPDAARKINDAMAGYGVAKLEEALGSLNGKSVLILGLAYRANVKEASHSSTLLIAKALEERGARPIVHDPLFSAGEIRALDLEAVEALPEPCDAIIVQAWHDEYQDLDLAAFTECRAVLDGRNVLDRATVEAAGMRYLGIGR